MVSALMPLADPRSSLRPITMACAELADFVSNEKELPMTLRAFACLLILSGAIAVAPVRAMPVTAVSKQLDGVLLTMQPGLLRLQVMSDAVIRITYAVGNQLPQLQSYSVVVKPDPGTKWDMRETPDSVIVETQSVRAQVDRETGAVEFLDRMNRPILAESAGGREISPAVEAGVAGTLVRQSFVLSPDEGIYGLGQHQQGIWNYRGHTIRLLQENREVGIPVILSSQGYSLLWDNPAVTDIDVGVPAEPDVIRWTSEVGDVIDYYFIYGPTPEASIRHYRALTGEAPLMPEWLFGFWQSKERYRTQDEVLGVAQKYRELNVPIDGIIQDWRYWPDNTWGSHQFDPARYPDPAAMTRQLHDMHYHILISVWPKFDLGTSNFQQLEQAGAMFDPVIPYVFPPGQGKWYDPFSSAGREIYWKQISTELFSKGFDGWWLDAPEPELSGKWGEFRTFRTAGGPGARVFNAYPLMHSTGIYQGQRAQTDQQRVVILTRSAYAGQQRNSAITWSGDIRATWQVFRDQIPAGLNFSVSGIPYWNTDIGGSFSDAKPSDPSYAEIFARWFEFGSFCPMFRVHGSAPDGGTGPGKEYWRFDDATQAIWRTYDNLRYRLMPYTYSVAWQVTSDGSTIMRPLIMDFSGDKEVLNIGDQYLFGPAIMVNPVTAQGAISRDVYLPGTATWYDFWTGKSEAPARHIDAPAPLETMPLYVRAGSIIPMGPLLQYVGEKPANPIELRIYRGANGSFTLYEDEGDSYHYERGIYATIPIIWSDASHTLTIGARKGTFPGMLRQRTFNVVFVTANHGVGVDVTTSPDRTVTYSGRSLSIRVAK
jgi:alpha-D-xyloside xylohydrolase